MVDSIDISEREDEMRGLLKERFDPSEATLDKVIEKMGEAQQMEELADMPHWKDLQQLADGIESFSRGYGLQAGWNTWIGIQRTDTSHLTIDTE